MAGSRSRSNTRPPLVVCASHLPPSKRNVYITLMTASARAVAVAWRDRHCTFLLFSSYGMPRRAITRDPSFADDLRVLEIVPAELVGQGLAG